jgi:hypothetical protein
VDHCPPDPTRMLKLSFIEELRCAEIDGEKHDENSR